MLSDRIKIYFPLFSGNVSQKIFNSFCQNPGVGGTQFCTIVLATLLANKYSDVDIALVNYCEVNIIDQPANFEVIVAADLDEFLARIKYLPKNHFIVLTASLLMHSNKFEVLRLANNIIGWVHHPFQYAKGLKQRPVFSYVHVGVYQYYSNELFFESNWQIQNLFCANNCDSFPNYPNSSGPIRVIYLGALIKAKGFGFLARHWLQLKALFPSIELHVIGSSETYGRLQEHNMIPCDKVFANEILSFIPEDDIHTGRVVFHGNLGAEKFEIMRSAHLAILNPTGATEAFPASPLECMACGLPVIASDDYGMSDSMRFFPELVLRSAEEIPARVSFLLADRYQYEELSARSIAVAHWFDSQTDMILSRWRRLFDLAAGRGSGAFSNCPPLEPLYGSLVKLRLRQARAWLGVIKRALL